MRGHLKKGVSTGKWVLFIMAMISCEIFFLGPLQVPHHDPVLDLRQRESTTNNSTITVGHCGMAGIENSHTQRHSVSPGTGPVKKVLFWTPFFHSYDGWFSFYGTMPKGCRWQCEFTSERSLFNTSDAVIFNVRDIHGKEWDMPRNRNPRQLWILHNTEAPPMSYLEMSRFNGVFNWTSFVRLDSDVPTFYGRVAERTARDMSSTTEVSCTYAYKTREIAWAASNCFSLNGREEYVMKLNEQIQVDRFGRCGVYSCPHDNEACLNLLSKYKFYLAFENSNCRDYITEKLWRAYARGSIPVVLGGGNYTRICPPRSYIHTKDFESPKHLAAYLRKVSSNETLFNSYMQWRKTHRLKIMDGHYWCDLCQALHLKSGEGKIYHRLDRWFNQDMCHASKV